MIFYEIIQNFFKMFINTYIISIKKDSINIFKQSIHEPKICFS